MSKRPSKSKKKTKPIWSKRAIQGTLIFILGLFLVIGMILWSSLFKDYPIEGKKQLLAINDGDTYSRFIDRLAEQDHVNFPIVLKLYQRVMIHDSMKKGVYEVRQVMSVRQVMEMIANAENAQMNRILVIEGTTFKQLIEALKKDELVTKEVSHLPYNQMLKALNIPFTHPEGLFAPNTYFFAKGETDRKILTDLYQRQMKSLDDAWNNRAADLPYKNKYEALIMASIIEKETNVDRELEQVSGVFARRLQLGMRLQTDPTVIYGMGSAYDGSIRRADLLQDTPYNTYTRQGLPPTPIAMPSESALAAAASPAETKALYFVARNDGTGASEFSETLQQHNRAVQRFILKKP